ncbi:hypothetical protein [Escherichia coli]|uniref:hypothetical protein n=1 Tax=Escherichia coli TaxID=562 RepID=UPI0030EB29A9
MQHGVEFAKEQYPQTATSTHPPVPDLRGEFRVWDDGLALLNGNRPVLLDLRGRIGYPRRS